MAEDKIMFTTATAIMTQSLIVSCIATILECSGLYDPKKLAEALRASASATKMPDVVWAMEAIVAGRAAKEKIYVNAREQHVR